MAERTPGDRSAVSGEQLFDLLFAVVQALGRYLDRTAVEEGLTPMQAMVLHQLDDAVPVPMSEIARRMHCDTSNATGLVDRLEQQELIVRVTPPTDRRVRAVTLTERGRAVWQELDRRVRAHNPLFAGLDRQEKEQLAGLLNRMLAGAEGAPDPQRARSTAG